MGCCSWVKRVLPLREKPVMCTATLSVTIHPFCMLSLAFLQVCETCGFASSLGIATHVLYIFACHFVSCRPGGNFVSEESEILSFGSRVSEQFIPSSCSF